MAYQYGVSHSVEIGGITFHYSLNWVQWRWWTDAVAQQARKVNEFNAVLQEAAKKEGKDAEDGVDDADLDARAEEIAAEGRTIEDKVLGFIVGWDGVVKPAVGDTDAEPEPVPFSRAAMLGEDGYAGINIGIIKELMQRLELRAAQVTEKVEEENPFPNGG